MRSFIANQYTDRKNKIKTLPSSQNLVRKWLRQTSPPKYSPASSKGEVVLVDSERTLKFIYNMYFLVGNVGSLLTFPTVYIERQYGFWPAYALGLGCICVAFITLISGRTYFGKRQEINLLPLLTMTVNPARIEDVTIPAAKVITCAARHGFRMNRADPEYQLAQHGRTVPWTSQFASEIARALGACRVL